MQQTFVAAWRSAATAKAERGARPWLFTIARNAVLRLRRRPADRENDVSLQSLGEAAGFAAEDATPERFAIGLEERALLEDAMQALDDGDREIIQLRDIEGVPGEQVAELLGLSVPAMKSRLHRARLRLVAEVRQRLPAENRT